MAQRRIRAVFMRGGTSRGLIFRQEDMPPRRDDWAPILTEAMGSPDPNSRQLDGMGGGYSSVSKVCVVGPPTRADADVDFTFGQVLVERDKVDYSANCGNMSSAIGPFAIEEGLVPYPGDGEAVLRIHNANTGKVVVSRFAVAGGEAVVDGDLELDGVAGSGAPIRLDFLDPGGANTGRVLPTGNAQDRLVVEGMGEVDVSLVDIALPVVFVRAADVGMSGVEMPGEIDADEALKARLEAIRRAGAVAMGMAADLAAAAELGAAPKIAMVSPPAPCRTLSGRELAASEFDLAARMISMGNPHRALALTGSLCIAAACRIPGTLANEALADGAGEQIRLGHPSGVIVVGAEVDCSGGEPSVSHATVYRTARRLFEGQVLLRERS